MDNVTPWIKYAIKAVYAGAAAFVAGMILALLPDSNNVVSVTAVEGWTIAGGVLAAAGGVFGLTNGPHPEDDAP